ncbi:(2Fe-2S)-binding protein [Tahibacter amnicola]|uniref:(2Fe-2S)-binding protein n=1 Tax=Tahibacter amnicola TaxID=2976241 RepID=A0ABY6BB01_9GAMM|nr:(2Fe-2S)-binding protein [Tahibacter amnicola]UXI67233.1 (2Fe-2S)-binding protein [Tahibacter amnicola]
MPHKVQILINGRREEVPAHISVAAAIAAIGQGATRRDLTGAPRAACCGMGVCFECRVRIDGAEKLGCLTRVSQGMEITTDA